MSNLRERFQQELVERDPYDLVFAFGEVFHNPRYQSFVFVEGPADENFYRKTSHEKLSKDVYYQCGSFKKEKAYNGYSGKKAVLYSLKGIAENRKLSQHLNKCTFIIDKDFEESIEDWIPESEQARNQLHRTKGHSVESYLFEKNNIGNILRYINYNANVKDFLDKFNDFAKEMSAFYAVNSIITGFYNNSTERTVFYRHTFSREEILSFDFSQEDFWLGREKAQRETELMMEQIVNKPIALKMVEQRKEIIEKNIMLVRGHDAFAFIYQYAKQKFNKNFDIFERHSQYSELIKELFVELEKVPT